MRISSYHYCVQNYSPMALPPPDLEVVRVGPGAECLRHGAIAEEDT